MIVHRTKDDNKTYEVIDGARRLKIAQKIGLKQLPCHLVTENDFKAYETSKATTTTVPTENLKKRLRSNPNTQIGR